IEVIEVRLEALRDAPSAIQYERADEPTGAVPMLLKHLGERRLIVAQVELTVVADAMKGRKRAGEERGVRRQRERRHPRRLIEPQAARGQRVDRGRLRGGVPVAAEPIRA